MKNKSKLPFLECFLVLLGEVIVSLIVCLVYFIIQKFTYKVITGVALGTLVTVLNFLFLAISTNRIFDKAAKDRGTKEMTEEEIQEFNAEIPPIQQIELLKEELSTYDYIGVKIAMGVGTKEEYAEQIAYTETLRQQIRDLENQIK